MTVWAVLAVVFVALVVVGWSWGGVLLRRPRQHGPTVAQIAAMPTVPVLGGRFTLEAVLADIDNEVRAFARRLDDEMRADIEALDAIQARFRIRLAAIV